MFDFLNPINAIEALLKSIVEEVNTLSTGIAADVSQSPQQVFGDIWDKLMRICSTAFMPIALCIIAFLMASELYNLYVKNNGKLDLEVVCATFFKFVLPYLLITHVYDFMAILFQFCTSATTGLGKSLAETLTVNAGNLEDTLAQVREWNWFQQLGYWIELLFIKFGFSILWICAKIIVYGRLFQLMILWLLAPIPCASVLHSEENQIFKNFIKTFAALVLQGAVMVICIALYSALVSAGIFSGNPDAMGWSLLGYSVILIFMLFRSEQIAKRVMNTF